MWSVTCIPSPWLFCALCRNHRRCVYLCFLQRESVAISVWLLKNTADTEVLHCKAFFLLVSLHRLTDVDRPTDEPNRTDRPTNQTNNQPTNLTKQPANYQSYAVQYSSFSDPGIHSGSGHTTHILWTHMTQNVIRTSECQKTAVFVKFRAFL